MKISICCFLYNSEAIADKLIEYLKNLDESYLEEIIFIDNNSTDNTFRIFEDNLKTGWSIYKELNPGLTNARVKAIELSKGDIIVFCDDDNLFDIDYITNCNGLFQEINKLGIVGPGVVIPVDKSGNKLAEVYLGFFQYKNNLDNFLPGGPNYNWKNMPAGTGMCILREIGLKYVEKVKFGLITTSDRKGNNLTSGGDTQIVLLALDLNYAVGISGKLKLNHLTIQRKLRKSYLYKMYYGVHSTAPVFVEIKPDLLEHFLNKEISSTFCILFKHFIKYHYRSLRLGKIKHLIAKLGERNGILTLKNKNDYLLNWIVKILKLN